MDDGLGRRAVRGAMVTVAAQGAKMVVQFLAVVILARLLTPQEYGLIAMVMVIIGVADIFRDFGLSSAAVRSPDLTRDQQVNLFWVNTCLGMVLSLLLAGCAGLVASFYGQPDLKPISIALAVNFLINGMATQYRADLMRRMEFNKLAVADIVSPAIGLVAAIALALAGAGFWALVGQQLVTAALLLVLYVAFARWLPGLYRRHVPIRQFMRYGINLATSNLISYLGKNIDTFMLGIRSTPEILGVYNRTYQLIQRPVGQINAPITQVAVPVLSKVQDDEPRFHSMVAKGQLALGYTLVAALGLIAGMAAPVTLVVLGDQWEQAIPIMRFLAVAAAVPTLSYPCLWVYITKDLVHHLLPFTIVSTVIKVVLVVIGSGFGVLGVAGAMALSPIIDQPLTYWWLSRRASIPVRRLVLGAIRISAFSAVLGVVGYAACQGAVTAGAGIWLQLAAGIVAGAAAYALAAFTVPPVRRDVRTVIAVVRKGFASKFG